HLVDGKDGARRVEARCTIPAVEWDTTGQIAKAVGVHVATRKHKQNARHDACCRCVNAADGGMCDLRPNHRGMRRAFKLDIVGVAARACNQCRIFEAANRLTNAEFHMFIPSICPSTNSLSALHSLFLPEAI